MESWIKDSPPAFPYAHPLAGIDRIVALEPGVIRVVKAIAGNEPYFIGHYPAYPIFPGNFMIEVVHQAVLYYARIQGETFVGLRLREIRSVRFYKPLYPGDRLEVNCVIRDISLRQPWVVEADCQSDTNVLVAKMKLIYGIAEG